MYMGVGFHAKFDKANSGNPGAAHFTREFKIQLPSSQKN